LYTYTVLSLASENNLSVEYMHIGAYILYSELYASLTVSPSQRAVSKKRSIIVPETEITVTKVTVWAPRA